MYSLAATAGPGVPNSSGFFPGHAHCGADRAMSLHTTSQETPEKRARGGVSQDGFMTTVRHALEHIHDANWLDQQSALASAAQLGVAPDPAAGVLDAPTTGIKPIDVRIGALWREWSQREKSPTQALLWSGIRHLAAHKETYHAALLTLAYLPTHAPRPNDLITDLAVGKSTYYRHLDAAIGALELGLIAQMRPSLRLEMPSARALVGRDALLRDCLDALRRGDVLGLFGASGLGKTALGASLCEHWRARQRAPVFWYTIRPGLNDNLQQLIYALAFFLHEHGFPQLWLHLLTNARDVSAGKALDMIRKGLEQLGAEPPLLCIDEVDLLLPSDLADDSERARLRAFIESLAGSPRGGAPMLLIGQRLLTEHQPGCMFELGRLSMDDMRTLLERAGFVLDGDALDAMQRHTRGNALLVQLLIALHHVDEPLVHSLLRMSTPASMDWFLARLRRHLSAAEQTTLDAICVHEQPAPAALWRKEQAELARLIQLNLVEAQADATVIVPPTLRAALYINLPELVKITCHLNAAREMARRGAYTVAAQHFLKGGHAEMAIWIWHTHMHSEIRQGQASTALQLFGTVNAAALSQQDRRALALILAQIHSISGDHEAGLQALDAERWSAGRASSAKAQALRGALLAQRGDLDNAVHAYRDSLDRFELVSPTAAINLRTELGRHLLARINDPDSARKEAQRAQLDIDLLNGRLDLATGDVERARERFSAALRMAATLDNAFCTALAHEALGFLETREAHLDLAVHHFRQAGEQHARYGNLMCAQGMITNNIAFAYMSGGRYVDAIPVAESAVAFFEGMQQPYWLSLSLGNLAEAYAHVDRLNEAEALLMRALAIEEEDSRAFLLVTLAYIKRRHAQLDHAARIAHEAADAAAAAHDLVTHAQAWAELGAIYGAAQKPPLAQNAFMRAAALYADAGMHNDAAHMRQLAHAP
jgi:tetratricopeptide (TPR) repeat protein